MYLLSFGQRVTTGKRILLAGLLCSLVLVVAVTYRGASGNEFHFDDYDNIVRYGPVRMDQFELQALADAFMHPMIEHRNVPSLTFAIDWWRGGGEARAFLQTNVFLHILTTLSLFGLLVQLLRRWAAAQSQAVMLTAFAAAAIWAVHPINSQAVNLIVQRMAILATLFVLLSLSCYLIARTRSRPWRIPWFVAAVAFGLLGAFSKENAWILPLLLLGVEYGVIRHGQALIRGPQDWLLLSLPFLIAAYVALDLTLGYGPISDSLVGAYDYRSFSMVERLLTQPRVIFFYLSLVLWPLPGRFSLEHDFPVSTSLLVPPTTLVCILGLVLLLLLALWLFARPTSRIIGMLLLWPFATLAIESSFVPLELVFEHRMYLPMAGLAALLGIAIVSLASRYRRRRLTLAGTVALATIGLSLSTSVRTSDWQDALALQADAVRKAPDSARAWTNLGLQRYVAGDRAGAIDALETALELSDGKEPKALEHLGVIYLDRGDLDRAEVLIDQVYRLQWSRPAPSVLNHKGEVELARERYASAVEFFALAIDAAPWNSVYYWNIALAYEGLGECEFALRSWREYLERETDPSRRVEVERHIAIVHGGGHNSCGKRQQ
jgi:hypothetical protein